MTRDSLPLLSKSRFTAGLQCLGRLYRTCYQRELATPPDAAQQARFDAGNRVGEIARELRPGGVLITESAFQHDDAVARTRSLLSSGSTGSIYEAAFTEGGVRIRADLLAKSSGGWEMIEVKSSTSVKAEHVPDAAVQLVTLEQAGIGVDRVSVAHVNTGYVYRGGAYVANELLTAQDITAEARSYAEQVPAKLAEMWKALSAAEPPQREIESYCKAPYACEFYDHCRKQEPEWSIEDLPRIDDRRRRELRASGVRSIPEIPATFRLTPAQQVVWRSLVSGQPYVSPGLGYDLARLIPPVHYIDFETIAPALPVYPGTRPYEAQPFQWSDHVQQHDGSLEHYERLSDGGEDPRREFGESLLDRLSDAATIVVYSGFEQARLRQLQVAFQDLASPIQEVLDRPWVDLLKVVREHYYQPEFHGSYSIKSVLPALVPGFGYQDLNIHDGESASLAYLESVDPRTAPPKRDALRANLLAYCGRDTEAMVLIVDALKARSS
jgi:predicted RecB family nuclease